MKKIKLTKNKEAIVCDCHYDLVKDYKWYYDSKGYAMRTIRIAPRPNSKFTHISMAHAILGKPPKPLEIDHIDRNPINNQCSNLRLATSSENKYNRRGWKCKK